MTMSEQRTKKYQRVSELEALLSELNGNLADANRVYLKASEEQNAKLFVVGAHRSGSTLFMQWLASTDIVAYPTNLLSRFYGAPLVGARIQQLLTDARYNFRDEILDFNSEIAFSSENGKTKGALAPNEFWYFWRRFLPFKSLDFMPTDELKQQANLTGLRDELNALSNIFEKPFALKGLIINQNIPPIAEQFNHGIFIWIRRDPVFNIQSALQARKEQLGDMSKWYSFKIKEYPELADLEPLESVTRQIIAINHSVAEGLAGLPEVNKIIIDYEDFCQRPQHYYEEIVKRLIVHGHNPERFPGYTGPRHFPHRNDWRLNEYTQAEVTSLYQSLTAKK